MKKYHGLILIAGGVLLAPVLSGCGGGARDDSDVQKITQDRIKKDAGAAKKQLNQLQGVTMKGGELSGGDAQGRPLWRVSAKQIRVFNEPSADQPMTDKKGDGEDSEVENEDGDKDTQDKIKQLSAQPKRAELTDARAMLYKEGKLDSTFLAPRVIIHYTPAGARIQLTGGVQAKTEGGWTGERGAVSMTAPRAELNVKDRKVWASGGVRMVQGQGAERIYASSSQLKADVGLKTTQLLGEVKGSSAEGQFSAQQAAWNWETHRASASGAVTAKHEKMTVTGSRLEADTAAGRGVLSGGVRAVGEQGKATASSVRYDWKNHTILASGGVLLVKDGTTLRAGQINSDDKFENAVASGAVTLKKDDTTLRAGRVQVKGKGDTATASGGVTLVKGDAQISAATATAYNIGEKNANVTASGDVRVRRGDITLLASRAQASGLQDKSTLRVVASGGVYARNSDGAVRAGSATYGGGRIVGSNGVTLYREGHRLSGSRLVCDDKFTTATLTGSINGRLANGGTVAAKQMIYRKNQGLVATGGVAARRGELRLRADKLNSTPDGQHLVLNGNVVVTHIDGTTIRAPQVRYDRRAEKIYASGNVYLHDPSRGLRQRGRGLVADLRLKEATLTGVTGSGKMDVFKDKKLF